MAVKALIFITVIIVGILVKVFLNKMESLALPAGFTFNDQACHLAGMGVGLMGSEDLALGKHGVLFITSGDLHNTFTQGADSASPGGMWVLDMRKGGAADPVRIQLGSFPEGRRFQGHGLDVSNNTDRVYSISHNGDHSSVDIFQIDYKQECLDSLPWDCQPVSLNFIRSVNSSIFPNYGINDVVEAEENQIYVTQWQPFDFPIRGTDNPDGWLEKLQGMSAMPIFLMGLKMTQVFHCSWTEDSEASCEAASEQKFLGANGLTIDQDRSMVFVNDPVDKMITVMERDKNTGKLSKVSEIKLPYAADNIEYDDEADEIIIGTIPDIIAAIKKSKGENIPTPGGMIVAHKDAANNDWIVQDVLHHDGTKLSLISAAARWGKKVVLGSPFSEGILVCQME
eukprot:GFUD01021109.1.p1 GENE.GFUD01021109.1~~GFUD01021109.1.p1  ORF type:complete len:411 (+),score=135.98 GFUD01021109.1:45-1235(+)